MKQAAALLALASGMAWGGFRASVVKIDITPDKPPWLLGYAARQSTGVHDPLYHRIVALDDGKTQFYLVSTDIALFSPAFYDEFCVELRKETGTMHGTVLGGKNQLMNGDAPEVVAAYVEEKAGAPMLFPNGATGDIAPIYSVYDDFRAARIAEFNVLLGDRIVEAVKALPASAAPVNLEATEEVLETPAKPGLQWPGEISAYLSPQGQVRLPLRLLRLNTDTALWAAPLELFCEIAMDVRAQSKVKNTFYIGYANGWLGSLPTKKAFPEGGYETTVTPFTADAKSALKGAVLAHLK